jgi:DNA polymerase V
MEAASSAGRIGEARITRVLGAATDFACSLPLGLSPVHAGFPSPAEEYSEQRLDLNDWVVRNPSATFYLHVEGVSMVKAGILPGDVLAVDRSETAINGDIVIARIDGEDLVKRYQKNTRGVWLIAEAEDPDMFPPLLVNEDLPFEIWGVVIAVARRTREGRGRGVRTG